jgi:mono/diheme cytochrome c family protein
MRSARHILGIAFGAGALLTPLLAATQAQTTQAQPVAQANRHASPVSPSAGQVHSEGERIFAQNCSRCHTAPDGFSPRISGTVVRHMRVRAQLSQHDEEELLRFFNP